MWEEEPEGYMGGREEEPEGYVGEEEPDEYMRRLNTFSVHVS